MAARSLSLILPVSHAAAAEEIVARHCRRSWREPLHENLTRFTCVVQKRYVERFIRELAEAFGEDGEFSLTVTELEVVEPPLPETEATRLPSARELKPPTRLEAFFSRDRLSTNELYDDIEGSVGLRSSYLVTVLLSTLIAALGMRSGQTAVVIGAMVIAPLLGPTMALALAATVGDAALGRRAAWTLLIGAALAFGASVLLGALVGVDLSVRELTNRAVVQPADIALALASGAAGVLAFSQGASLSLVGVMIAVALVPPLAAAGLFVGNGELHLGGQALLLFATNLVCINAAGIVTFLLQGLPPRSWRMTGAVLAVWFVVLVLLAGLLTLRAVTADALS